MKTLIAALAAATAVAAVAGPAAAHPAGYDHGRYEQRWDRRDPGVNARQAEINRRIAIGLRTGALTRHEADRLRHEAREIARLEARYRQHGFSWNERADLDRRMDRLERQLLRQSHDRDYGYGYGDRYGYRR